jgi:hypothetical protein
VSELRVHVAARSSATVVRVAVITDPATRLARRAEQGGP